MIELTGSRSKLIVQRRCRRTIPSSASPTSRWRSEQLGWQPTVPLDEGLKKTIAYFDAFLKEAA